MSGWCSSKGVGWTWENVQQLVWRPTPPPASLLTHAACFQSSSSTVFQQTNQLYLMSRCSANLAYRCTEGWPLLSQRALLNRPLLQMVPCGKPAPPQHTHTHHLLLIGVRKRFVCKCGFRISSTLCFSVILWWRMKPWVFMKVIARCSSPIFMGSIRGCTYIQITYESVKHLSGTDRFCLVGP